MEPFLRITPKEQGERLDVVLAHTFPGYSRSYLQKAMQRGAVVRKGIAQKPAYRVNAGETFEILDFGFPILDLERPPDLEVRNPKSKIQNAPSVLFEDTDLLVINKPAGLVVHPAPSYHGETLMDWLRGHLGAALQRAFPDPQRLGLVHRLDKNTSGVLVIAKNIIAQTALGRQFHDRRVKKTYAAFVEGSPASSKGVVSAPVGRSHKTPTRMAVTTTGRASETTFEVLERFREVSRWALYPKTGRTHQIRVHVAAIGHPVVGDHTYGSKVSLARAYGIQRPLLHAECLDILHPTTHKTMTFKAPWPEDFCRAHALFKKSVKASLVLVLIASGLSRSLSYADSQTPAAASPAPAAPASDASAPKKTTHHHASSSGSSSSLTTEVRHLRKDLDALKEKVSALESALDSLSASQRLHDLEQAVAEINGRTVASANSVEEVKTQVMDVTRRLKDQQTQGEQLRDQVYRLQQQITQSAAPPAPAAPVAPGATDQGKKP